MFKHIHPEAVWFQIMDFNSSKDQSTGSGHSFITKQVEQTVIFSFVWLYVAHGKQSNEGGRQLKTQEYCERVPMKGAVFKD